MDPLSGDGLLHHAVRVAKPAMVKYLLQYTKYGIHDRNYAGETPRSLATFRPGQSYDADTVSFMLLIEGLEEGVGASVFDFDPPAKYEGKSVVGLHHYTHPLYNLTEELKAWRNKLDSRGTGPTRETGVARVARLAAEMALM